MCENAIYFFEDYYQVSASNPLSCISHNPNFCFTGSAAGMIYFEDPSCEESTSWDANENLVCISRGKIYLNTLY